ncbi:hypothetical protein PAXRUDRAFT_31209 [Paxillus rubicundulus Ve08.2h10]|uniref:PCI domain-containing protein n=1 Tax=Paxillus rubicundulus Ve08.2h10 TaxID=930991 RepID=A0A0D0DJ21_9AGAM|nr:hypothetical protein PAXRUDRAFT_31209 [Paxillus rubicundulus Ve08.2h10]
MSSSISVDSTAPSPKLVLDEFIAKALSSTPAELHPFFEAFDDLYTRKLWHQLTLKLFEFFDHPLSKPFRVVVFQQFVRDFGSKMNQQRLVELGTKVSKEIDNPQTQLTFLTSLLSRIDADISKEAYVLLLANIAQAKLVYGDLEGTKKDMDTAWKTLDQLEGVDNAVNASYYRVAADYYKAKAEYAPYYKHSLLYLACVDVATDLTPEERLLRAHDLGISAFLGDTIYNFGELLMHPILDALDNTQYDWIKKLLFTFNEGNIGKFEALAPLFPQEPILEQSYPFLRQKICLMALIESVFKRNANDRTMSFQTIAEETRLALDEVEHLIMKALSLKLIRGTLDQVDQKAHITWVQPRVLSRGQIGELNTRLGAWIERLSGVEQRVAPEVSATA